MNSMKQKKAFRRIQLVYLKQIYARKITCRCHSPHFQFHLLQRIPHPYHCWGRPPDRRLSRPELWTLSSWWCFTTITNWQYNSFYTLCFTFGACVNVRQVFSKTLFSILYINNVVEKLLQRSLSSFSLYIRQPNMLYPSYYFIIDHIKVFSTSTYFPWRTENVLSLCMSQPWFDRLGTSLGCGTG